MEAGVEAEHGGTGATPEGTVEAEETSGGGENRDTRRDTESWRLVTWRCRDSRVGAEVPKAADGQTADGADETTQDAATAEVEPERLADKGRRRRRSGAEVEDEVG